MLSAVYDMCLYNVVTSILPKTDLSAETMVNRSCLILLFHLSRLRKRESWEWSFCNNLSEAERCRTWWELVSDFARIHLHIHVM